MTNMISDILMLAGALGVGFYCLILSRRLRKLNDLESGVGGAVTSLSSQVDGLVITLKKSQETAHSSSSKLEELNERAEATAKRLELLMASLHDYAPEPTVRRSSQTGKSKASTKTTARPKAREEDRLVVGI